MHSQSSHTNNCDQEGHSVQEFGPLGLSAYCKGCRKMGTIYSFSPIKELALTKTKLKNAVH